MLPFGPHAPENLRRAVSMGRAPDLYVNSSVDEATLEVRAFEPLVGSHGGLGGWQDRAVLVVPTELDGFVHPVESAADLHEIFVAMLEHLGHRQSLSAVRSGS